MIYVSITLFALSALGGMYLLALVLQKKETPKFVAFIHGLFAATALVLLVVYACNNEHAGLTECIVLFVLAALGGSVLIVRDLTGRSLPKWLALGHGLIAVSGFVLLLVRAFA
jgi:hypothetical protein